VLQYHAWLQQRVVAVWGPAKILLESRKINSSCRYVRQVFAFDEWAACC